MPDSSFKAYSEDYLLKLLFYQEWVDGCFKAYSEDYLLKYHALSG